LPWVNSGNPPRGEKKMNITVRLLTALALSCTFTLANADVVQVWDCKMQEGKTGADLDAASSVWLAAAKKLPGNSKLEAWHNFPIAANTGDGGFSFVTITPDFKAWGKATEAYGGSSAAKADQAWEEVASCSGSSLWASEQVK
jgi:hypothetical protein